MKCFLEKKDKEDKTSFYFRFVPEEDDKTEGTSYNAGKNKIMLLKSDEKDGSVVASFDFPFSITLPHNDLCAMAALKIISPYIGSEFEMVGMPVSHTFANAVYEKYPNIKIINASSLTAPRMIIGEKYAVSFSGGADSVAVADLMPYGTPLILSSRKYHDAVGEFEPWFSTDANIKTLQDMPDRFVKINVRSDFEFLSTNGSYCIYPDNYSFTIPCILLADHLGLTGIYSGDILAAFTAEETRKVSFINFNKMKNYYRSAGLDFDSPVKGVTEIGTEIINSFYGTSEITTTCQYGKYKQPCMKCIKCFRKTLIKAYINKHTPDDSILADFNKNVAVSGFLERNKDREPFPFGFTYNEILKKLDLSNYELLNKIKNKSACDMDTSFLNKVLVSAYYKNDMSLTMQHCLNNLLKIFDVMTLEEEAYFF